MSWALAVIRFGRRISERWREMWERAEERRDGFPIDSVAERIRRLN